MDPYKRAFIACDEAIRHRLETGERAIAVGRCTDITEIGTIDSGSSARDYILVTNRKVHLVPGLDPDVATSLDLDDITDYEDRTSKHRYAMLLRHPSVEHPRWWPAREMSAATAEILRAEGKLRDGINPMTFTELAFSRRDTAVARALRRALKQEAVGP